MPIVTKFVRVVTHYKKVTPSKSRDLVIFIFSYESCWFRAQPPKLSQTSTCTCVERITLYNCLNSLGSPYMGYRGIRSKKIFYRIQTVKRIQLFVAIKENFSNLFLI